MTYFSRVILDASNPHANRLLQQVAQNGYREHQLLWQLFPNEGDASRDFIYRSQQQNLNRVYYLVSKREPEAMPGWVVASKLYAPKITKGTELAFSLRVNPVVTRKDNTGKSHRHDIVMDAKKSMGYKELKFAGRRSMGELIQEAGISWLKSRSERNGFVCSRESITVESYDQHRSYKSGSKFPIRYSSMDIAGVLCVNDVDKFMDCLCQGVGPAKAFGCGLMLVRRT